ncbi:MAG: ABC transporter permease, partial [Chloroflexi bacterium]|nr:ABC transporter permease [Chloroflexota bacterium]
QIEGAPVGDEEAGDSAQALNEKTRAFLETSPAVASFISHGIVRAVWEGTEDIFLVRALGDDLGLVFPARKGRRLAADGEAMVSQSVASEKGIGVGDEFTLLVGDNSVPLCVVGVYFDGPGNEPTILTTMETLARARITVTVDAYGVQATSTEVVGQLMSELSQATGPRVEAYSVREALDQGIIAIRSLSYILDLVLLAIVAANVLATASLTVRERFRDLATMKMLGMTPRQVARSVTSGSLALSLVAVMAGLPLGLAVTRWLIEIISRQVGLDQGIARLPGLPWLAIIVPVTLLVVAAGSALPARLAGRLPVAEALRME